MFLQKIVVGNLFANCYIVAEGKGGKGIVIDPGDEGEKIIDIVNTNKLQIIYIIATHAHIDHIGDVEVVQQATGAKFLLHSQDSPFLKDPRLNLSSMTEKPRIFPSPQMLLNDGEILRVGEIEIKILHTPGHTPGSICLKINECVFTGDTLFAGGVGRTDLSGGNLKQLQKSIAEKLLNLPPDTQI
ncbi:MAG TPA: MBL fold metallo-hydrolase, partial [Candidatus Aerophobetes bacterium]|nr:MBL fold metallo-hydrolase [Candidatus Aerophobetes bacterium]